MEDISLVNDNNMEKEDYTGDSREYKDDGKSGDVTLYLTFLLGSDLFGIPVNSVREVIEYKKVFKTPRVPDYIKGVINLRGEVVPIIDLTSRFYNNKSDIITTSAIVVVEISENSHKIPMGVIIDSVKAVVEIGEDKIDATPDIGSRIKPEYLDGIGKVDNEFVILLNIDAILNIEELSGFENNTNKKEGLYV